MVRSIPVFAVFCVVMIFVVPLSPIVAASSCNSCASETGLTLFPGVRGITLTEVGVDTTRTRDTLVEVHNGMVDVKIRDPLATSTGKREVPDLSSDVDLAAIGNILGRDGYVVTGVTVHHYQTTVVADVRVSDPTTVTVGEEVTYYTFTNVATNTNRVVMAVQVRTSDGTPVGERRFMVTPIIGETGIVGSDELMVYEPQGDTTAKGERSARGGGIETGEPNERTPLLTHTGMAVNTVLVGTVGAAVAVCVGSSGIACPAMVGIVLGALVVFAGVNVVGYMVDTASYTMETHHVAETAPIREFTLVENSVGGGMYVPRHSHLVYHRDGSVQVTTHTPWWKRWSSKGLMSLYVPLTTDDSESYAVTATRDIEAPSGSEFVFPTSNSMVVKHKGKTILDAVVDPNLGCGQHGQHQEQSRHSRQVLPPYYEFIEYAHQKHMNGIKHLEARLVVPSPPTTPHIVTNAFATLWIGVESSTGLVQPVLGYDHQETEKRWAIAAWAIRPGGVGDIACGPKGHSEWYYPQTGETLNLALNYDSGRWEIVITDVTSHRSTRCFSDVVGTSDVTVYGGVLEGANMYKEYGGQEVGDKNLPGTATFSNIQSNVPLTLTGVVDPNARNYFTNLGVDISPDSKAVTLHTANSR